MNVQVIQISPIPVAMLRHMGSYDGIGPVFESLVNWAQASGVPIQRTIGIYWDNPDYVPTNRLRSAACDEIPANYPIPETRGLPIHVENIPGGLYATTTFTGPYEDLAPVWTNFTNYIEGALRRTIKDNPPAFEVYVNDASTTPPSQLITELYMPVY